MARDLTIKIRVTDAELAQLHERSDRKQLAVWMRELCLATDRTSRIRPPAPVDPQLLRQLAGIGNNVNQIARRLNSGEFSPADRVGILTTLVAIERELSDLRAAHDR